MCIDLGEVCSLGFLEICFHICQRFSYMEIMVVRRLQREGYSASMWVCVCVCLIGSCRTDMPRLKCAFPVPAVMELFLSTSFYFFLFPPTLIYPQECLFHSPRAHPTAITSSNRCRAFSIRISPIFFSCLV